MRNLYLLGDAAQDNMLFTPVKLEGIASLELQRDERIARSQPRPLQNPDEALNWGIRTRISIENLSLIQL
jgi:hypothetical protein